MEMKVFELLMTRLSHDLVGASGAISNGIELLDDENLDFLADTKKLLSDSSNVISSRLKFFRSTFGVSGEAVSVSNVRQLISDYISVSGAKPSPELEWNLQLAGAEDKLEAIWARLIQILCMLASDTIIKGGKIEVNVENGGALALVVAAVSPNLRVNEEVLNAVQDNGKDSFTLSPKSAPIMVAIEMVNDLNGRLSIKEFNQKVEYKVEFLE